MASENHKRRWRNLLLNKGYQLRFTLVMVGLSTALMVGLGFWVMRVADETTEVSKASVMGTPCPAIPELPAPQEEEAPAPAPAAPAVPMNLDETAPAKDGSAAGSAAGKADAGSAAGTADAADDTDPPSRRKITVSLDPMEMPQGVAAKEAELPPDYALAIVKHWTCRLKIDAAKRGLEHGRDRILLVMIATGLLLVLGLAAYGIKMTHKVAGPLFKVSLYLKKMRDGRFDKVYNLRKGDQLLDFYEHFRQAHAGVVKMQQADIERVQAVIAAAESAGAGDEPAVRELRNLLARKEKSIE
jgi:hypothetical protein